MVTASALVERSERGVVPAIRADDTRCAGFGRTLVVRRAHAVPENRVVEGGRPV